MNAENDKASRKRARSTSPQGEPGSPSPRAEQAEAATNLDEHGEERGANAFSSSQDTASATLRKRAKMAATQGEPSDSSPRAEQLNATPSLASNLEQESQQSETAMSSSTEATIPIDPRLQIEIAQPLQQDDQEEYDQEEYDQEEYDQDEDDQEEDDQEEDDLEYDDLEYDDLEYDDLEDDDLEEDDEEDDDLEARLASLDAQAYPRGDADVGPRPISAQEDPAMPSWLHRRSCFRPGLLVPQRGYHVIKKQMASPHQPNLPASVRDALLMLQKLERGRDILSPWLRDPAHAEPLGQFIEYFNLDDNAWCGPDGRGSNLTPQDVDNIVFMARLAFDDEVHYEQCWNRNVHLPLLQKLYVRSREKEHYCGGGDQFIWEENLEKRLTLAATHPRFIHKYALELLDDGTDTIPVRSSYEYQPGQGRTTWILTAGCPVTPGTSMAEDGRRMSEAVLRVTDWHAEHWSELSALAGRSIKEHRTISNRQGRWYLPLSAAERRQRNGYLAELGALHGILVQRHQWTYIATSPWFPQGPGQETVNLHVWLEHPIGRTDTALGVHQIASFVEHLAGWNKNVYAPWFERMVAAPGE